MFSDVILGLRVLSGASRVAAAAGARGGGNLPISNSSPSYVEYLSPAA
jgi:hypothetical protein